MKEIKFKIPEASDFMRWYEIIYFKLTGGFTCTGCGEKTQFNHVHFDSTIYGKPLIFENNTHGLCAECTRDELNGKEDIVFVEEDCKCDWCGESKKTMSFPRHEDMYSRIHFGSNYWNGHHMCQSCMNLGFSNRGPNHSSVVKRENGKLYNRNELGIWIEMK